MCDDRRPGQCDDEIVCILGGVVLCLCVLGGNHVLPCGATIIAGLELEIAHRAVRVERVDVVRRIIGELERGGRPCRIVLLIVRHVRGDGELAARADLDKLVWVFDLFIQGDFLGLEVQCAERVGHIRVAVFGGYLSVDGAAHGRAGAGEHRTADGLPFAASRVRVRRGFDDEVQSFLTAGHVDDHLAL